jgi:hypothetical protein
MKTTDLTKLLLAAAIPGAAAFGVIPVTDNLGIRGYIDGSYKNTDLGATKTESLKLDNADVDFLITTDKIKSEIHLSGLDTLEVEQAFITYDLGNGLSITGGRFESMLGFEGDEQYKLYQNSYANDFHDGNFSLLLDQWTNHNYQQGLKADYKMDSLSLGASVVDSAQGYLDGDAEDLGFELSATYNLMKGFTIGAGLSGGDITNLLKSDVEKILSRIGINADNLAFLGINEFGFEDTLLWDELDDDWGEYSADTRYNIWAQYDGIENLILAAEYDSIGFDGLDTDTWMVMANYSFGNSAAITLRYSETNCKLQTDLPLIIPAPTDEDPFATTTTLLGGKAKLDKITVSPSYSFTDNLLGVVEYSRIDAEGTKSDFFAVEGIFTF